MLKFFSGVALVAALAFGAPAIAQPAGDPPGAHGGGAGSHGGGGGRAGGAPVGGRGGAAHSAFAGGVRGGRFDFHGRAFSALNPQERGYWGGGQWMHTWHNGVFGWWWFLDDYWYFYPEPIYPYPTYIAPYDYNGTSGPPLAAPVYWYRCDNPPGFYPYVSECPGGWEAVPAAPSDAPGQAPPPPAN